MITSQAVRSVDRGNVAATGAFSIKATGKAFRILSDGLYSDKIMAVIRELSCNAYDAHVAAGNKDKPFEVHLPNRLEPWFSVKDYGTGLSDDQVMRLYTTYFDSTKTESNDFIGALGLGSKSPFSYVDSFTVTARHNGVLRTYTAYIGEDGVPSIAKMAEDYTDEPNGLEVSMPVKMNDYELFYDRAVKVLKRFNPLPVIKGAHIRINPPKYVIEGSFWKIREHDYNNTFAIQGMVAYPINTKALQGHLDQLHLTLLSLPIDIEFPLGELEVAASREELSYDKRTIDNIKTRLTAVFKELIPHYQQHFDKCKTLWEAKLTWNEMIAPLRYEFRNLFMNRLKWNGQTIDDACISFNLDRIDRTGSTWVRIWDNKDLRRVKLKLDGYMKATFHVEPGIEVYVSDGTVRFIQPRLKYYWATNGKLPHKGILIKTESRETAEKVLEALGNPPDVIMIADLPDPPRKPPAPRKRTTLQTVYEYDESVNNNWAPLEHDVSTGGLYINLVNFIPYRDGKPVGDLSNIIRVVKALKLVDEPILGIPATHKHIPTRYSGWRNFFDVVEENLKPLIDPKKIVNYRHFLAVKDGKVIDFVITAISGGFEVKRKNSPLGKLWQSLMKVMAAIGDDSRQVALVSELVDLLGIKLKGVKPAAKLDDAIDLSAYPLFSGHYNAHSGMHGEWIEYINFIDAKRR